MHWFSSLRNSSNGSSEVSSVKNRPKASVTSSAHQVLANHLGTAVMLGLIAVTLFWMWCIGKRIAKAWASSMPFNPSVNCFGYSDCKIRMLLEFGILDCKNALALWTVAFPSAGSTQDLEAIVDYCIKVLVLLASSWKQYQCDVVMTTSFENCHRYSQLIAILKVKLSAGM